MKTTPEQTLSQIRSAILDSIKSPVLTHEQKVTALAAHADSLLDVLDLPEALAEELEGLLNRPGNTDGCICDLSEGHAPLRPRYIVPDYEKFMTEGSPFLQLPPPGDLAEALDSLLILYKHVPSVTNYPVYLGALDQLLEPFLEGVSEEEALTLITRFLRHVDRTVLDAFSHANIGPQDSRAGRLILKAEAGLCQAVPNLTLKYDPDQTPDDFALLCIETALTCAKPSFANHPLFRSELGTDYVIASCYNGLKLGGGSYTLCRLILGNIAKRAESIADFKETQLPMVCARMAAYMDARIRFEVEESGFFLHNFLAKEGLIHRDRFTAMFGLVGLADCVNLLLEKEGIPGRFGHDPHADQLGLEIMEEINALNNAHHNPYCEATDGHFLLHAQVGLAEDQNITPGVRIPIGEEPEVLLHHLRHCGKFHPFFPSGAGDIFPMDSTVQANPAYLLDMLKGAFREQLRYLSFYSRDSDVVRITGYLVKRSEIQKLEAGENVLQGTTALGMGAVRNGHALARKLRQV